MSAFSPESEKPAEQESLTDLMHGTALQLVDYSLEVEPGDHVLIKLSPSCHALCEQVLQLLAERGATWRIQIIDLDIQKLLLESVSGGQSGVDFALPLNMTGRGESDSADDQSAYFHYGPGSDEVDFLTERPNTKVLVIRDRKTVSGKYKITADVEKMVGEMNRILTNSRVEENRWCLIAPPTESTPLPEGVSLEEYSRIYYAACRLPWKDVEREQSYLVEAFTNAEQVSITIPAPDGFGEEWSSRLSFTVIGQKPVNSVAQRNMPGAEVFMAPNAETLNGVFAVPYPVYFKEILLPDLRLTFVNGKVTEFFTSGTTEDTEFVTKTLNTDAGASICGEFGIGTNPTITLPVPDTLLAEKTFGIHLALGNSYAYTEYFGTPVNVFNGNKSSIHIDIPRIMTPKYGGGTIEVDGKPIFSDGKFLDPRIVVLNGKQI